MDAESAREVCHAIAAPNGSFSTSRFADRAGLLGRDEEYLIGIIQSVPGVRRISHSWWRLPLSKMWKAVRNLGYAVIVTAIVALLLV